MRALAVLALVAGLAGAARAADSPPQLTVTVYNSDLALVQDVRQITVPAGKSRVELKDVSAAIRPETVTLSGRGLSVVEQNFDYDLLTPAKLMEKAVGKQIRIVRIVPGTGQQTIETATVLSVNDGVVLKIGDHIEVLREDGVPTRVIFDSIPENLRAQPTLSVTVDAQDAGPRDVTLSYLTNGLSWQADYVALFDERRGALDLQGWITLTNKSGTSFKDVKAELVAGDFHLVHSEQEWQTQRSQRPAVRAGLGVPGGSTSDYRAYPVAERVTVADNQTKQVGLVRLDGLKTLKAYQYEADRFESDTAPEHVSVALRFSNAGAALPAGIVRVYTRDEGGEPKFIGENHIDHTPAGSDLAIPIGDAFDVTVQPTLVSSEKLGKTRSRYAMSYLVRNASDAAAVVDLKQSRLGMDAKVVAETAKSRRVDASTLEWEVQVPPHGETTLAFTVEADN